MLSQEIKRISPQEWKCQDITEEFDYPNKVILGAGTYGKVYKVQSKSNQQYYAVKCIKMLHEKEGFPITSLREIKLLMSLNHENVIKINQIYTRSKRNKKRAKQIKTYCAMDIMAHDFFKVIKNNYDTKTFFTQNQVRSVLYQCFCGLQNIHENRIIHRDIKSANILMTFDGIVKIADFGLAKFCPKYEFIRKTPTVVTLSYRAPEVLLTRGNYDFLIDVWSMGYKIKLISIFAMELCLNKPIFKAKDDADQLRQIMELCGTPTDISWPEIIKSEYFIKMKPQMYPRKLISYIRNQKMDFDDELLDLLDKILVMNPQTRLDVNQILKHNYFTRHDMEECYSQLRDFVVNIKEGVKIVEKTKIFRDSPVKLKL